MARAQVLHWFAVGLIMVAVVCFMLVPVLGTTLIIIGLGIETLGYLICGVEFWGRKPPEAAGDAGPRDPKT